VAGLTYFASAAIASATKRATPSILGTVARHAEPHHHQPGGVHDHDVWALGAARHTRHKGIGRHAEADALGRPAGRSAIGPEAGTVAIGFAAGGEPRRIVDPTLGQNALAARPAVVEVGLAETRPITPRGPHVARPDRSAGAVELERDMLHAELVEQFTMGKAQHRGGVAAGLAALTAARSIFFMRAWP
jgi:hypothetical protein